MAVSRRGAHGGPGSRHGEPWVSEAGGQGCGGALGPSAPRVAGPGHRLTIASAGLHPGLLSGGEAPGSEAKDPPVLRFLRASDGL